MSEKENMKPNEQETPSETSHLKKQQGRYSSEKNKKVTPKVNKGETGQRGKKQRREFKLDPNRG
jgi:hypothetical protein